MKNIVNQIVNKGNELVALAESNGWVFPSKPNFEKWALNKLEKGLSCNGMPFDAEDWDWETDLIAFVIYVLCTYGTAVPLVVISYPDWEGGRYNEMSPIEGDVFLHDFEYIEWRGTSKDILKKSLEFKAEVHPSYEPAEYYIQTIEQLFYKMVFTDYSLI